MRLMKLPDVPRPRIRGVSLLLDGLIAIGVIFVIAREAVRTTAFASLSAAVGRRQLHALTGGDDYLLGLAFGLLASIALLAVVAGIGVLVIARRHRSPVRVTRRDD